MKKTLFLPNNKTEDDMNIRIGDIVRFISDKLEGKVTGIIDNNTVNVYCDEYGFEIPASVNNLVVIHSDSNMTKTASATSISGLSIVRRQFTLEGHNAELWDETARRFEHVVPLDLELLPADSMLREFYGSAVK